MSGAGAASRVRATAGVATVWGRALHAELVKVVTLPAMWWSAAAAGGAAVATMTSVLRDVVDGRGLGFEEVAPVWALAVQIGFVAAGVAAAGAEHSTAQGMTSLLVTPARGRLAAARLMVLTGTGLVAASILVGGTRMAGCPAMSTTALWAGGRTVVWLTAVLLLSAGLGAALRSVTGASAAAVVLVVLAPQLAVFLGDAARWLPGQAAQIWLTADASRAEATSAGLIILAWTSAAQIAGIVRLVRADG
ncbi:ABC-2 family transporter protein [Actinomyces naeslundii]|uniref:cupin n=1 Tax=Actinomyces naeslundii TaxID=1655 RepID=UPI00195C50C1|nr:cupin [Actinomyces naeslundii]VTX92904.1 ABC-2 family transporter protein [Actinomyces naeslundii]